LEEAAFIHIHQLTSRLESKELLKPQPCFPPPVRTGLGVTHLPPVCPTQRPTPPGKQLLSMNSTLCPGQMPTGAAAFGHPKFHAPPRLATALVSACLELMRCGSVTHHSPGLRVTATSPKPGTVPVGWGRCWAACPRGRSAGQQGAQ